MPRLPSIVTVPPRSRRGRSRHACPIIHVSTDYVFDGAKPEPYVETDPANPAGVYGRSKLEGETAVRAANPRHLILRTAWLYAPYGQNFLAPSCAWRGSARSCASSADQRGNPTYVPHLADTILAIAAQLDAGARADAWGIYHAAADGETTWAGFAAEIVRAGAQHGVPAVPVSPIATAEYPTPAARPANSRLDCSKLAADIRRKVAALAAGRERMRRAPGARELL